MTTTFKRVALGDTFISQHPDTRGQTFRKVGQREAFALVSATDKLRPNRGLTHAQVSFTRSTAVTI